MMTIRMTYRFYDANSNYLGTFRAETEEDAWMEFAKVTELYSERPRYASEDVGETLAAIIDSLKEGGVVVRQ